MKKYSFKIRGNQYDVEIHSIDGSQAEIEVNGTKYDVEINANIKTSKTPVLVRPKAYHTGETAVPKTSKPTELKGNKLVKAPLPGTILEIRSKVGDDVKMGQTILVMEAMKMENDIKASMDGKIISIKGQVGDTVLEGDVLVEIGGN